MTDIAFFTRLLDEGSAVDRYRLATEQIRHAEKFGFARAWVAQHHFHAAEGGLPSPFVFLSNVAAKTRTIRLGTGIVTLTLEDPIRVAEDAVVADLLSGGRVDLGIGSGGTPASFIPFGLDVQNKGADYDHKIGTLFDALNGEELGGGNTLYPSGEHVRRRVWQATFSPGGGIRAGEHGDGLLLSRTQPRVGLDPATPLHELQLPIIDAYRAALPEDRPARITASRTVFVADHRADAIRFAEVGLRGLARAFKLDADAPIETLIQQTDTHLGTPDEVAESLSRDRVLEHADEVAIQVHSVDPPSEYTPRSLELFATEVAPRFGWGPGA